MKVDIAIIGGGIMGVSIALSLLESNINVAIIERDSIGSGATSRSAGIFTRQLLLEQDIKLVKRSIEIISNLERKLDIKLFHKMGFLTIMEKSDAKDYVNLLDAMGIKSEFIEGGELMRRWNNLKIEHCEAGVYTPEDGILDTGSFIYNIKNLLIKKINIFENFKIKDLKIRGNKLSRIIGKDYSIEADKYVFTLGAWTRKFFKKLNINLPLKAYKCQAISLKFNIPLNLPPAYDEINKIYWAPESPTRLIVGNGSPIPVDDPDNIPYHVNLEFIEEIGTKISMRIRGSSDSSIVSEWIMVCDSTPDGLPIASRCLELENVYIISGLDGYGLMRSIALGESIASILMNKRPLIDISAMDLERFRNYGEYDNFSIIELY